jgi:hypothetical protein
MPAKNNENQEQPKQLSPIDALQVLDRVTANYQGNRQDHILIQQSLAVIHQSLSQAGVLGEEGEVTPDTVTEVEAKAK